MNEEVEKPEEKTMMDDLNGAILQMIKEAVDEKSTKQEQDKKDLVMHVKLVSGQEVIGAYYGEDKKQVILQRPMKVSMGSRDSTTVLALELWSPFDISELTSFLWVHILSAGVVDSIISEYYQNMWIYQNAMIKPQTMNIIASLNKQLAQSLSAENLKFLEEVKKNKDKIPPDFPETLQ